MANRTPTDLRSMAPAALCALLASAPMGLRAQPAGPAVLRIKANEVAAHVSPRLYGLITEELNYANDGGPTRS